MIALKSGIMVITWAHGVHPRLAILGLLRCTQDDFASHFGIKCSSFSKMNVGTSRRSACDALGNFQYLSVQLGNALLERTVSATTMVNDLFNVFPNQGFFKLQRCLETGSEPISNIYIRLESHISIWNFLSFHDACSIIFNETIWHYQSQADSCQDLPTSSTSNCTWWSLDIRATVRELAGILSGLAWSDV